MEEFAQAVDARVHRHDEVPPRFPIEPDDDVVRTKSELIEEDLLVEDVSIDGMCGVY